jgi:hypothetical protein
MNRSFTQTGYGHTSPKSISIVAGYQMLAMHALHQYVSTRRVLLVAHARLRIVHHLQRILVNSNQ